MIVSPASSREPGDRAVDWRGLLRRWWLIIFSALGAGLAFAVVILYLTPARYTAEASLVLEARKVQVILQDAVVSRLPQDSPVLRTELDVISSRSLAEQALEKLGEARSAVDGTSTDTKVSAGADAGLLQSLSPWRYLSWSRTSESEPAAVNSRRADIDRLLSGLRVSNDGRSYTIFIAYTDKDPIYAARVANAFAEAYLDQQTGLQAGATRQASAWLGKKLDDLRSTLQSSEMAVEDVRRKSGLVEANGTPLQVQRLDALNRELVIARANRAGAEARLATARRLAQEDAGASAATFPEVLNSPVIQLLRKDQAQFSRDLVSLENAGASKSAQIPALKSQLDALQQQIATETERVLLSLANEVDVARRKEEALASEFKASQASYAASSDALIHVKQLEREADANRTVYESFLNRYKQTLEQDGLAAPEARLVSRAEPPRRPSTARLPVLVFGLVGGLGIGLGLAMMMEHLDDRVRTAVALEQATDTKVLAQVPLVPAMGRRTAMSPIMPPGSAYDRAFAKLQATLRLSPQTGSAKVIMVTSASTGDGKTTTCVSLARSIARGGEQVVVIDADWHRPAVAAMLRGTPGPGLADLVRGGTTLADCTQIDRQSGVHFIAPGSTVGLPQSALGSEAVGACIAQLRQRYDIVLIDTPPVLSSAEAALVGRFADATLFIVRWGRTGMREVVAGLRELSLCGLDRVSLVLGGVDPRLLPQYGTAAADGGESGAGLRTRNGRLQPGLVARPSPAAARAAAVVPAVVKVGSDRS
ncbi:MULTISPECIES: polysaccharide biosynthesis tyrosine autokinase [unclassified Chelatococcus]|uniref:GumC family protein n=1 Tax=unclassified Chelatococcus TaxID=2638111 RepID=UPI001BCEE241|nr:MULTISPECIES: polysaccharide biosynthesis tyrosine autokinase [unclassified Chelatococcus]MBS7695940.1 polysaccharide biosynthesis tyrosine autokinase [Chelatococcus sp. YT9]MBX3555685.1 polysaccharide biosynthesis tyrosine autokinase [Chelatococcus sp.]